MNKFTDRSFWDGSCGVSLGCVYHIKAQAYWEIRIGAWIHVFE